LRRHKNTIGLFRKTTKQPGISSKKQAYGKTIMKVEKALTVIGKKLEKEYTRLGFKYLKKYKFLMKRTKKFDYYIFFSPYFANISGTCIELRVTLLINDRTLLKTNINANSEVFRMDLWEMGNHYNIVNGTLLDDAFIDLQNKIEGYLLSHIKILEAYTIMHNGLTMFR
jgi:hypothetical protein